MRNISPASITTLQKNSDIEPVILVKVYWGIVDEGTVYSDRRFEQYGFQGKIQAISGIEDVIDINNSASSASVDIILDDTDGSLKTIFNTNDIHKTRVQILQWFTELPVSEAFIIFEGEISSPITWKESDRTLSFSVITKLEDKEVGYSVEEGTMTGVPQSFIGKAWPMVFGTVGGVPALLVNEAPVLKTLEGIGIVDEDVWNEELDKIAQSSQEAFNQWQFNFIQGLREAYIAARYSVDFPAFGLIDDPEAREQHNDAADQYFAQASQYFQDYTNIQIELNAQLELFDRQKAIDNVTKFRFRAFGKNLPVSPTLFFQIGDYIFSGQFTGTEVININRTRVTDPNRKIAYNSFTDTLTLTTYKSSPRGEKFVWIDAGQEVQFLVYPLTYIISIGHVTILRLYAFKDGIPVTLPLDYYVKELLIAGNLAYTKVTINPPLTARGEGWDNDEIFADVNNAIGPNIIDIFEWAITIFTPYTFDTVSFNEVKAFVTNYPANFALLERKNIIEFLKEIAFQSRCSIWLNDSKFYVRYLPKMGTPVESIILQDVVINTLEIGSTDTERLITKFVATYRSSMDQAEPNKIIYKYNVQKYGTLEETYDFYIYNSELLVQKSAEFWLIRFANTFKIMRFKTALHKLKLETFDHVLINIPSDIVCEVPVVGIVQKAVYDSETNYIDMEVWIPVRFGEMVPYDYAFPKDLDITKIYPVPDDPKVSSQNPFENANGEILDPQFVPQEIPFIPVTRGKPWNWGRNGPIGDQFDIIPDLPPNLTRFLDPREINRTRPDGLTDFNNVTNFQVRQAARIALESVTPATFPGFVLNRVGGNNYTVSAFIRGTNEAPVTIPAFQLFQRTDETIPPGTPVAVHRMVWRLADGSQNSQFFMQVAVWLSPQEL